MMARMAFDRYNIFLNSKDHFNGSETNIMEHKTKHPCQQGIPADRAIEQHVLDTNAGKQLS
jgi:hypothetical protein